MEGNPKIGERWGSALRPLGMGGVVDPKKHAPLHMCCLNRVVMC